MMKSNSLLSIVQINRFSLLCFLIHEEMFREIFLDRYLTLQFEPGIAFMRIRKCCLLLLNVAMLPNEYCFLFPFMTPEITGTYKEIGKMN